MPLAALTPVLNDLLHKGGNSPSPSGKSQSLQQGSNSNESANSGEYSRTGSNHGQSTNVPNTLTSSSIDDVSI